MQKALQQQEKLAMRLRQREATLTGPKDDTEVEWDALAAAYRAQYGCVKGRWAGGSVDDRFVSHGWMNGEPSEHVVPPLFLSFPSVCAWHDSARPALMWTR